MPRRLVCTVLVLVTGLAGLHAAVGRMDGFPPSRLFPGAELADGVPSPRDVFGFDLGARPLRPAEVVRYFEALAAASPRAKWDTYAHSHEGRPLVWLAVGEPETIARLDAFRDEHARRVDPRTSTDAAALERAKAVAWMAYGIHGDELSSVDAAVGLAYWLVAGEDERARRLRRELVVLIDPCENPDGRERFLAQTTSFAHTVPNPDAEDISHTTVWPWGRGNHYLFDLNRDWFSMVHPESRRSAVIATWNPQLMVDSHEMGTHDTYLFSPPRHPFNPHLPPSSLRWADRFAADQARALDARGYAYYTREWNEEFFPGYGSSWATYLGAVGILYEMSGTEGTLVRQRGGVERTYPQAVEHQIASSVANLTTLADGRAEILRDFVADRREAIRRGREGPLGAWLLPEGRHPERTRKLVGLLRSQGIEVYRNSGRVRVAGLRDARTGGAVAADGLPDTVWMVPLDQPAGPLVRQILDPHVPMDAAFLREEREYLERGRGTRLYETTAWSLALAYGIDAWWTRTRPDGAGWTFAEPPRPAAGAFERGDAPFGWLVDGVSDAAVPAVADLLQREVEVRVAGRPFRIAGRSWQRGALLIRREGNVDGLERHLEEVAARHAVGIHAVGTAKAEEGPDLGGSHFPALVEPRVGVWTGSPVSPSSYGALWHLFDEVLRLRFSGLELSRFSGTDLGRYNVLVFPPARGGRASYRAALGEQGWDRLRRWIDAGGTAIGIGSGAEFLADAEHGLTRTRLRRQALERFPPVVLGLGPEQAQAAGTFRATGMRAPAKEPEDDGKSARPKKPAVERASPYDVAPLLGPGARPFAEGVAPGTPASLEPVDLATWLRPYLPPGKDKPDAEDLERADERLRRFSPRGTFVRVDVDPELWLAWGLGDELPALVRTSDTLVAEPPVQVPARFADLERLHLGGLLWPERAGRLALSAYATREGVGRGQVVLFLEEPEFRGWTLATRRLLTNAVLYGPGLGTRWSTPW